MVTNGRLPSANLVTAQKGILLSTPTATAWRQLVVKAKSTLGRSISIAEPAGGYRSFATQHAMQQASLHGTVAEKKAWGLSTTSTAALADAGQSPHGLGICVDIVGTALDERFLDLAKTFGFTRPIAGDPNHFQHDGKTAISVPVGLNKKKIARFLNAEKLGRTTTTATTGKDEKNYVWLIQKYSNKHGRYPSPPFKIDDERGPRTNQCEKWIASIAK